MNKYLLFVVFHFIVISCNCNIKKQNNVNVTLSDTSVVSGTLFYFNDVPWLFNPIGAWTPEIFFDKENIQMDKVKVIQLSNTRALSLFNMADSLIKAQKSDPRSLDVRYAIVFEKNSSRDTLFSIGDEEGHCLFLGNFFADSLLIKRMINIIADEDPKWKEEYDKYFYDGHQQPYTKEFMIEHGVL